MNQIILEEITKTQKVSKKQIETVLALLDEGNTIPFIARYRKEATNGLDEEQINAIFKEWEYANNLFERKEAVIRLIDEKGMLTNELKEEILKAQKLVEVEDLYRPFKEKKKTKATEAIAKGLEPLAKYLLSFPSTNIETEASKYLNDKVKTLDEALEGACFIIAELISDDANYRKYLRDVLFHRGNIVTKIKKDATDPQNIYQNYYDYFEPISKIKPHRVLAVNRAENEKIITAKLDCEKQLMLDYLTKNVIKKVSNASIYLSKAIEDSLKRLIYPSIEREIRSQLTEIAEDKAIENFSENLQKLLLQPPLKGKIVLGIDPAFRTGCKLSVVDKTGAVLEKGVIYPHEKAKGAAVKSEEVINSKKVVISLINKYKIDLIAIGNGTASRETEKFIATLIKEFELTCKFVIVNEAGASVYSASDLAREEFPDFSVEERSAASIARRLQDPLSELVKIDPKSIGVGQYQHDVSKKKLGESLNFVVTQAVNSVGVNINTASKSLLMYISGLNKSAADNIIKHRTKIGEFKNRTQLLDVPKLGGKTYEQAVGFLRIPEGEEILDVTAIHPESYPIAKQIMKIYNITSDMLGKKEVKEIVNLINVDDVCTKLNVDKYTVKDILDCFSAPLRDPRDQFNQPLLKSDVLSIEDLKVKMELEGVVRNVIDFGMFVDVGLKNDGMVHISKMSKKYIKHPKELFSVGDIIKVYVLDVDVTKGKVALSMFNE